MPVITALSTQISHDPNLYFPEAPARLRALAGTSQEDADDACAFFNQASTQAVPAERRRKKDGQAVPVAFRR